LGRDLDERRASTLAKRKLHDRRPEVYKLSRLERAFSPIVMIGGPTAPVSSFALRFDSRIWMRARVQRKSIKKNRVKCEGIETL
jgi:hypothetical protein